MFPNADASRTRIAESPPAATRSTLDWDYHPGIVMGSLLRSLAFVASTAALAAGTGSAAPAPPDPDVERAKAFFDQGAYARGEPLLRARLAALDAVGLGESGEAAEVLDLLLVSAVERGVTTRGGGTGALYERARSLDERLFGPESAQVGRTLRLGAELLQSEARNDEAIALFQRAIAVDERAVGRDAPEIASALCAETWSLLNGPVSNRPRILADLRRAGRIQSAHPRCDPQYVSVCMNTEAILRLSTHGKSAYAESQREILRYREARLGPSHPLIGYALNNLAVIAGEEHRWGDALHLYHRALSVFRSSLGEESPLVSSMEFEIATIEVARGATGTAIPLVASALAAQERELGPESGTTHATRLYYARLLDGVGEREEAEAIYRSELDAASTFPSLSGPLARFLIDRGELERAQALLERNLPSLESNRGIDASPLAELLEQLGEVHRRRGRLAEAEAVLRRALVAQGRSLPIGTWRGGQIRYELARVLASRGDLPQALEMANEALAAMTAALGARNPARCPVLLLIAEIDARRGGVRSAIDASLEAERLSQEALRQALAGLPERQALGFVEHRTSGLDLAAPMLASGAVSDGGTVERVWDALIRARGAVFDEMAARHRALARVDAPALARLAERLRDVSARLANLALVGSDDSDPLRPRGLYERALAERDQIERALATASATFREELRQRNAGYPEIARQLPRGSVLVAYLRSGGENAAYLAFVLRAGAARPRVSAIAPAKVVDDAVARWREAVERGGREGEAAARAAGAALRSLVWDPLVRSAGEASRAFVVPDGALNGVSFPALPNADGTYLVENGPLFVLLSTERDLTGRGGRSPLNRGALVVGAPDFDAAAAVVAAAGGGEARGGRDEGAGGSQFRGSRSACSTFRSIHFDPLPQSAEESREIAGLLAGRPGERGFEGSVRVLLGAAAGERAFKTIAPGERVVHVATHGFFLQGDCAASSNPGSGAAALRWRENPLLLSGFALAGANRREEVKAGEDDGILTAQEIAALDLTGVEWVVLSGCDTGLGPVVPTEGVVGLGRAIRVAGARAAILSLWPVDDEATRLFMRSLYDAHFRRGLPTSAAVRDAARTLLASFRRTGADTSPALWGGFVAAGGGD